MRDSEERYRSVFTSIDEGFCICEMITDADGKPIDYRFIDVNPLFESVSGLTGASGRTALELVPSLEQHWIDTYARVGLGRETLRFELPSDAMGRWFNVFATPLASSGRFAIVFKDVSERKRNELALAESEAKFRTVTEALPQMVWSADTSGTTDSFNPRWQDFLGADPYTADGGWQRYLHPEDRTEVDRLWSQALETGGIYEAEFRLRHHSGDYRWVLSRGLPMRDEGGAITRWFGSCTDIHDMKVAQERQQLLLDEMDHRVKNILSLAQSVARQTFGALPDSDDAQSTFNGRLQALSKAYSHLNQETWSKASLREILSTSIAISSGHPAAVWLDGPHVMLPPKTAVTLSMAIHELCTNSVKYGALSSPSGRVDVRWGLNDKQRLRFIWQEHGGPPVAPPSRRGFGTRMIEHALAAEIAGTVRLAFDPAGVRCKVDALINLPDGK